jgi:hypothetical protein
MARAIEDRYPRYDIRRLCRAGNKTYPDGAWVIEKPTEKYSRVRYLDDVQLEEMYRAMTDPSGTERFYRLLEGRDVPFGPRREGKPPIDPFGIEVIDTPDRGDWGDLPDECAWIEAHDHALIRFMGVDPVWPNGCWQVEKAGCEPQLLDHAQVKYVAHDILLMPQKDVRKLMRRPKREGNTLAARSKVIMGQPELEDLFDEAPAPERYADFSERVDSQVRYGDNLDSLFDDEAQEPALENLFDDDSVPYAGTVQEFEWAALSDSDWADQF